MRTTVDELVKILHKWHHLLLVLGITCYSTSFKDLESGKFGQYIVYIYIVLNLYNHSPQISKHFLIHLQYGIALNYLEFSARLFKKKLLVVACLCVIGLKNKPS